MTARMPILEWTPHHELTALNVFIDLALRGPCTLVMRGDAGIGKTTLWREAVADARARSVTVLSCRPTGSEAQLPYAGLGDSPGTGR